MDEEEHVPRNLNPNQFGHSAYQTSEEAELASRQPGDHDPLLAGIPREGRTGPTYHVLDENDEVHSVHGDYEVASRTAKNLALKSWGWAKIRHASGDVDVFYPEGRSRTIYARPPARRGEGQRSV